MDSAINSSLALWNEYSNSVKKLLDTSTLFGLADNSGYLRKDQILPTLQSIISVIQKDNKRFIFITQNVTDALDLYLLTKEIDINIDCEYALPHKETLPAPLIFYPYTSICLNRNDILDWREFDFVFYDLQLTHNLVFNRIVNELSESATCIPTKFSNLIQIKNDDTIIEQEYTESSITPTPNNYIALVQRVHKRRYVRDLIRQDNLHKVMVITNTRQNARQLDNYLYRAKIKSKIIHENANIEAQQKLIDRLENNELQVIIMTDKTIAALGASLNNTEHLIFFDLPNAYIEFDERIDKIGQQVNPKTCISIASQEEIPWVESMKKECNNIFPVIEIPEPKEIPKRAPYAQQENQERQEDLDLKDQKDQKDQKQNIQPQKRIQPTARRHKELSQNASPLNNNRRKQNKNSRPNQNESSRTKNFQSNHNSIAPKPNSSPQSEQDQVINQNRSPFEEGSFEANIARVNKRRVRQVFSNQRNGSNHNSFGQSSPPNSQKRPVNKRRNPPRSHNNNNNNNNDIDGNQ